MRNMKKVTRVASLALASVLCLSACGGDVTQNTEGKGTDVTSTDVVNASTEEVVAKAYWEMLDEVSDTSELPDWDGDTLEITIWYAAGTTAGEILEIPETDVAFKEFERVTGVKFNVEDSYDNGGNNIDAKLPMVVGSGDLPNIIIGHDLDKQLKELYENGYLADLTEYYKDGTLDQLTRYMPLEAMDNLVYKNAKSEDGAYYLIPQGDQAVTTVNAWRTSGFFPEDVYDDEYYSLYGATPAMATGRVGKHAIMVRTDVLEALRPDALTMKEIQDIYVKNGTFTADEIYSVNLNSADEFYAFLREVQELLASGDYVGLDGKPMEVTYGPHTETDNWYLMSYMPSLIDGVDATYFSYADFGADSEDEVIKYAFEDEYYVGFMKDINALVRDDVIAQDSMLDNAATYQEKLNNLHYAVTYVEDMAAVCEKLDTDLDYSPIWVNVPFNDELGGDNAYRFNNYYGIFKDTLSEEELEQLMHAINYLNSIVGTNNFIWGPASAGLFTEDADGNRTYTSEALQSNMVKNEDNGENKKYGLYNDKLTENIFAIMPKGMIQGVLAASYLNAGSGERLASNAQIYFCPGVLPGQSAVENKHPVNVGDHIYASIMNEIQGLADFWSARAGYENQVKKVLVAESDAEFDKQLKNLQVFAKENGLTDEVKKAHNDAFVEQNRDRLVEAGTID